MCKVNYYRPLQDLFSFPISALPALSEYLIFTYLYKTSHERMFEIWRQTKNVFFLRLFL